MFDLKQHPHRRFNALTGEWVLVSPHRTQRPWQGQVEKLPPENRPAYDPSCYLCPGNARAGGVQNPNYETTFVFENDFAALRPDTPPGALGEQLQQAGGERLRGGVAGGSGGEHDLLRAEAEPGICRVVCFNPRHDLTLSRMTTDQIVPVIETWTEQHNDLAANPNIGFVQIFENRGEMMGASNPHPHCQIWSSKSLPNEAAKELESQRTHRERTGRCLLCDYVALEDRTGERVVCANESFIAVVPFWAVWPFELLLISRRHLPDFPALTGGEQRDLADLLRRITTRYDNLFEAPFPYTMGFHQRPVDGEEYPEWHFHAHYYPPLLRSATVRKFMVGYEMLGTPQRDITPESAALRLRELSETHYLNGA